MDKDRIIMQSFSWKVERFEDERYNNDNKYPLYLL